LIPFEVPFPLVTGTVSVVASAPTGISPAFNVRLSQDSPGLFTQNSAGTGAALASELPARRRASRHIVDDLSVFVGETEGTVSFAGLAPGFPGIYKLTASI
jgi:hypothetical protein